MDLSLFLGALGVILTVIFFVIGYRQTIGARRERARAANKLLVDTLFRRLALEDEFSLSRVDVVKLISGWAITARVRSTDIHSIREVEDLLLSRAVESDYITQAQRRNISNRITRIFAEEETPVFLGKRERDSSRSHVEWLLALGSALAAAVSALIAARVIQVDSTDIATTGLFESAIFPSFALILITTVALLLYTRARDISRPGTDEPRPIASRELDFERMLFSAAQRRNTSIRPSAYPVFDYLFEEDGKLVGVEVKQDLNKLSTQFLKRLNVRFQDAISRDFVSRAIVVSMTQPGQKATSLLTGSHVEVMQVGEFLSALRPSAKPSERT